MSSPLATIKDWLRYATGSRAIVPCSGFDGEARDSETLDAIALGGSSLAQELRCHAARSGNLNIETFHARSFATEAQQYAA